MELNISRKREFKNKKLQNATNRIRKAGEQVRINCYKIANELAYIHNNKLWVDDGYNDITDYALKILRIKKSMCYDLIRIGNELTADNGRESILHRPDGCKDDYSVGQLKTLLPLGIEKTIELADDEIITPDLSVRQIQRIVAFNRAIMPDNDDPVDPDDEMELYQVTDPQPELYQVTDPQPPEAVITIADGEIFTTMCFSRLNKDQLEKIINYCSMRLKSI